MICDKSMISSTNKMDCHDVTDLLFKVAFNTINQPINPIGIVYNYVFLFFQKVTNDGSPCKSAVRYQDFSLPYIENCVKMCYFAVVQDPPMYLDFEPGGVFDRLAFKEFTKSGTRVDYLVWPALYLYKDGPLLSKGVVQAIGNV